MGEGLLRPVSSHAPQPARPLSAEVPTQWRPKTSFWELHPAKGNSPPAANHSLTVPLCRNSTQAVSTPGPPLSIGQSGAGLPLAPWALLLCWGSPAPKTHSHQVLLRGEAGLGARRPSAPSPQPCPLSQLGRSAPRPPRNGDPKRASGSCILQRETLLGSKPQPLGALAQESSASCFRPRPCALPRAMRGWAAPGSLGPAALLGVSGARNPLPTGSPSWGSRIGRAKSFCALGPAMPPEPARPRSPRNGDPKRASWSCILQRETLLGQQTTAPTRLHSGKPRYPFSTPAHRSP